MSHTPERGEEAPNLRDFEYAYYSTEDALRVCRRGALHVVRLLRHLQSSLHRDPSDWYAGGAAYLARWWTLRSSRWQAALETAEMARHLPAADRLAPAARRVWDAAEDVALAVCNCLPCADALARALCRALDAAPPDDLNRFVREAWARLVSLDPLERWRVTHAAQVAPALRLVRADPRFRQGRAGAFRACARYLELTDAKTGMEELPRVWLRRARALADEAPIDRDALRRVEVLDLVALGAALSGAADLPGAPGRSESLVPAPRPEVPGAPAVPPAAPPLVQPVPGSTPECPSYTRPVDETTARNGGGIAAVAEVAPMPIFAGAAELARRLGQRTDRVESFLRRLREQFPDCYINTEQPRVNEPRYLYRTADVWPLLERKQNDWRQLTDG
jgi:hypothetical protein